MSNVIKSASRPLENPLLAELIRKFAKVRKKSGLQGIYRLITPIITPRNDESENFINNTENRNNNPRIRNLKAEDNITHLDLQRVV